MMRQFSRPVLIGTFLLAAGLAAGQADAPPDERIRVEHDRQRFVAEIFIVSSGGRIAWSDVLRGLARARGYDDTALAGLGDDRSIPLDDPLTGPILAALNLTLAPDLRFTRYRDASRPEHPSLKITVDRKALLASQRRLKKRLRQAFAARFGGGGRYGLRLDEGWRETAEDQLLVVAVHGFQSRGDGLDALLARPRAAGFACGAFKYPNDQPIADSARLLSQELRELARDQPRRRVALVTHSMGGLVARAALEDPQLDPGNVTRLIMISPPNHGSVAAHFGYGLDLAEYLRDGGGESSWFFAGIEDGLADAQRDLRPDSVFLHELNARPRNERVRYTIFLGDQAPLSDDNLAAARKAFAEAAARHRWVCFFGPKVDEWLGDFDEVVRGRGDGAVAVKRGRLAGVDDTLVLHFHHLSFNRPPLADDAARVVDEIMLRLATE